MTETLYIVQHCQSQHHLDNSKKYPDQGNGLTTLGRRQARAVADRLCEWLKGKELSLDEESHDCTVGAFRTNRSMIAEVVSALIIS